MSWNIQTASMLKQIFFDAGLVALGISLGLIFLQVGYTKCARVLFSIALVWLTLLCMCGGAEILGKPLLKASENLSFKSHTSKCLDNSHNIVVLAGGAIAFDLPSPSTYSRALGATQILQQKNTQKQRMNVILSGGYTKPGIEYSEASTLDRVLRQRLAETYSLHRVILEEKSQNTAENALYVDDIFESQNIDKSIVLVTETMHMPRAYATFATRGFKICAYPVENPFHQTSGLISFGNGSSSIWILNEYFGILGYWVKNWIDSASLKPLMKDEG